MRRVKRKHWNLAYSKPNVSTWLPHSLKLAVDAKKVNKESTHPIIELPFDHYEWISPRVYFVIAVFY